MKDGSKYVGLDVHKETIAVSIADAYGGEVRYFGEIKTRQRRSINSVTRSKPSSVSSKKF
jgi:hypothetical protein